MNRTEIQRQLTAVHVQFAQYILSLPKNEFLFSYDSKWTAGQQLDHIIKSTSPVKTAFTLPSFLLKLIFGKANRSSKSYDALVEKYQSKLAAGGKSTARFLPPDVTFEQREELSNKLLVTINALNSLITRFSETQLDILILPHPLLGKLTLREMLFFTIYHVGHHEKQARQNLQKRSTS